MTDWIYRVAFTGLDTAGAATQFHYATRSYVTSATHARIPNTWLDDRLQQPLLLRRDLFGPGRVTGQAEIASGEVILVNSDGELDTLANYGFDAQTFEMWRVDPANTDTEELVFRGATEQLELTIAEVRVLVRDLSYLFDRAFMPVKFAGSNTLPDGLEGTADDIKGQPKPVLLGRVLNIEPVPVNTSRLIYQLHYAALFAGSTISVFDKRVALATGITRPIADFQAGATSYMVSAIDTATDQITFTPAITLTDGTPVHVSAATSMPGGLSTTQYYYTRAVAAGVATLHPTAADATANTNRVDITSAGSGTITVATNRTPPGSWDRCDFFGAYIRLGSQPTRITCDVQNGVSADWQDVFSDVLFVAGEQYADLSALTLQLDDQMAASALFPDVGIYWTGETTIYQALRDVLRSVAGSFHVYPMTPVGGATKVTAQRINTTATTPSLYLDESNIRTNSLQRGKPGDRERGIPPWRVTCSYLKNWTVMRGADVAGAAAADSALVAQEYRTVQSDASPVLQQYPAAPELLVLTDLYFEDGAVILAEYMRNLLAPGRRLLQVSVPLSEVADLETTVGALTIPGLVLGSLVNVTYPRFGLDAGANLWLIGYSLDYREQVADLILWG